MTDEQRVLIKIVFDPHSVIVPAAESHAVSNAAEYSAARRLIERLKAGDDNVSLPLTIVVRKKSLLCGFEDILAWPADLVNYRDASLRPSIQKLIGGSLSEDITNERLLAWGIYPVSDLPTKDVEPHKLDEEWLIDCVLEKVTNCQVWVRANMFANENWIIDWFDFLLAGNTERLCSDDYLMQVIEGRIKHWLEACLDRVPDDLVELLLEAMSRGNGKQAANQLIAHSLLRQYGPAHTRVLVINLPDAFGAWIKKKLSVKAKSVTDQLTAQFYASGQLNTLVQDLDKLVRQEVDELNPEDDLTRYIKRMSGFFPSEYQSVVHRFCNSLIDHFEAAHFDPKAYHSFAGLLAEKFSPLLANKAILAENHQEWVDDLLALARTLHNLRSATPATMDQWWRTCTSMMQCEHLLYRLRGDCPPGLTDAIARLEDEFARLNKDLNNDYGDWLLSKFPEYLDDPSEARLVTQTTRLATQVTEVPETVILLVVDGLRWDWWQCLARHLAERGYQIESGGSMGLAMLPTVTNVSRRAALGRFPLSKLIDFVDDVYDVDVDPSEEALLAARVLGYADQLQDVKPLSNKRIKHLPNQYVYVNGATDDIKEAMSLPARHYVVIYTGIDRAAHHENEEQVLQETISTRLRLLAELLADEIDRNRYLDPNALRLIVTADHGCAHTRWSEQKSLPAALKPYTERDPHIERHGRVAQVVVVGDAKEVESVERQVKTFYEENKDEWYVIWGAEASKYGLPQQDRKGRQVICWLSPRNMDYLRRGNGLYVHGGFSLYETIVPLAILRYSKERKLIAPTVLFSGLDKLRREKPSRILVNIGNDNDQELTGVLSIPALRVEETEIDPVPPSDTVPTEVPVNPTLSGEVSLSVTLRYRIGPSEEMEWQKQYTVDIAMSRRELMELETKRDLF
ncbi:MAG: PglZ domain-containing protein [Chloroflexi bacterium]|nr:PglZ domain-containing protein [Chloroflexota bacterium]